MHSRISGVSDYLAEDESDALRIAREIMSTLTKSVAAFKPELAIKSPRFSADEILNIVPADIRKSFDARELIARICDDSYFSEFKPDYGATLICGYAKIGGYPVGFIANNGVLFSEAANKGTHFIQLCNRQNIPLIFLQNTTGFMVGSAYEKDGIIKHGAKLINAVSNSDVPTITILIGSSFGAGNYAMNGRAYQPRFLFSYPNAQIAVMGPEQLSGVMLMIQRQAAEQSGIPFDEANAAESSESMLQQVRKNSSDWYASGQGWDDGIIDPRDTRTVLNICLAVVYNQEIKGTENFGVFRM
jgi:acetyl-CoA carboxylase carboxyltransferase component